ncbi:hypothetical protein [Aeromicrobium sp. Leaf245]|uniref:hypothetical protein n=1 Tax=Aeromicrobium sp. Leaf245 TaxID=1736306 RepID=UPI0006F731B9|nr:hypothetical protein [Aeromicrobium sp. Leaf245]KQO41867.1 hypothetical protein ASF05_12250 [Aeromicrobium sp. Leaf245]
MTSSTDAGNGIRLAQQAVAAASLDDSARSLRLINSANEAEAKWAAAYLVDCLIQLTDRLPAKSKRQRRRILREAITNDEDVIANQVAVFLDEEAHRG